MNELLEMLDEDIIRSQREEIGRLNELLESTEAQCSRLQEDNRRLREKTPDPDSEFWTKQLLQGLKIPQDAQDAVILNNDITFHKQSGDDTEEPWETRKYHRRMATNLMELHEQRHRVKLLKEDRVILEKRNNCLEYENTKLKEKHVALADVIADLKMDLKARE